MAQLSKRTIELNGAKLSLLEGGAGRPLLFLHSAPGPSHYSSQYLELLAASFRVIAPVHPGFDAAPRPASVKSVDDLAYFYLDLMRQESLGNAVLAGAGLGGWIAAEMAIRCTSNIGALVLVSPFGLKTSGRETRDIADFFALEADERAELEFESARFKRIDYSGMSDEELTAIARARESEAVFGWKPFMHNPALRNWLHRIDVPTVLIRGNADRVVTAGNHAEYARAIRGARYVEVARAGHHPHVENPAEVVAEFQAFAAVGA